METFLAYEYKDEVKYNEEKGQDYEVGIICLKKSEDLEKVFKLIEDEDNFLLKYDNEERDEESRLVISSLISSKIKTGEIKLISIKMEEDEE